MRRIVVLGGGISPEREVSLRSSMEVVKALKTAGFNVAFIDPMFSKEYLNVSKQDVVFPILHGEFGEDGVIQKELEDRGIPYLGSDSRSSRMCFDKSLTRQELEKHGIPVAKGHTVVKEDYESSELRKRPHVLKAATGGSSIGTLIVRDPAVWDEKKLDEVFSISKSVVIEELVEGIEVTVPILDDRALPVIEIRPPKNEEFDYENKYNGQTAELCPPESVSEVLQHEAQHMAEKTHEAMKCRHLSRVDIIIRSDNSMVVLEINTIPGLTDQSLYPKSARVAGLEFPQLMKKFVELVERDYGLTRKVV